MEKTRRVADCHPHRPHQARGKCASCYQTWWKETHPDEFKTRKRRMAECHPEKPVLAQDLCGTCYRRKWRLENPGAEWDRQAVANKQRYAARSPEERRAIVVGRYGLTLQDFDDMLAQQGGTCAVCPAVPGSRPFQVDHCHATGKIRGILCPNCNSALGHAKDDKARLKELIRYLEQWERS